jgi:hypothetical protein
MANKTVPVRLWEPIGTTRIRTTDAKFYTGTGDPLPPVVRTVKKSPLLDRWRFRDSGTRDTVISTVTPEEDAAWSKRMATMSGYDGGLQWRGDMAPVGKAVAQVADALRRFKDKRRMKDALAQALCSIANYGNYLESSEADLGPADVLSFEGNDELTLADVHSANGIKPDPTTSEGARAEVEMNRRTGDAINAANAKAWANAKFVTDAVPRNAMAAKIQDMNRSKC